MAKFLKEYTNNLNDVDEITLKRIFKDYFFKHQLYSKSNDLDYRLIEIEEKMYQQLNNAGTPEKYIRDKSKYVYAHKILSDTIMNPKFIQMLDTKGFKELRVKQSTITKALQSLVDDKAALIYKEMFPDCRLNHFLKHLSPKDALKLESKIKNIHYRKKYRLLDQAIITLIDLIKFEQK